MFYAIQVVNLSTIEVALYGPFETEDQAQKWIDFIDTDYVSQWTITTADRPCKVN